MAMGPRLDIRQSQSLVMTPQLQQAIRLLALSNVELESYISEELERNPLLDSGELSQDKNDITGAAEPAADMGEGTGPDATDGPEGSFDNPSERQGSDEILKTGPAEAEAGFAADAESDPFSNNGLSESDGVQTGSLDGMMGMNGIDMTGGSGSGFNGGDGPDFENMLVADKTLADHLLEQAGTTLSGKELFLARHVIDHMDEAGYVRGDMLDIAHQLGVERRAIEEVLAVIQTFDPLGVGARSLSECLAIQAREVDRLDPAMEKLIDNLDVLAKGGLAQLKRICGVDDEDLLDMISELRGYDPKPGCRFGGGEVQAVTPDLFVALKGDSWIIEVNSATLPKVLVNRSYYSELKDGAQDAESKAWLNECLADASWLVKALDQRQRTIVKVATEIVKQQDMFFRHGVAHLRPLTLNNVAEAIEMHESTVSRVTSNKYISSPRGLFELKYFFTSGINSADGGEAVSAEAVKSHIKALIDAEEPNRILSDDKLVALLKDKGLNIARRTVAKYRESLGLGSSVQRRRQKALEGKAA